MRRTRLHEARRGEDDRALRAHPPLVERQLHVQEKLRFKCGETILTAEGPDKVFDKTRFGPNFRAQVAVSKRADSLPLYRQAKAYRRVGVQVDDSTLGDLFHRTAEIVNPLHERLPRLPVERKLYTLCDGPRGDAGPMAPFAVKVVTIRKPQMSSARFSGARRCRGPGPSTKGPRFRER